MGIQRQSFVGNPNKQEYVDEDEELEYLSGDEIDFNPFGLPPGDPDLMLDDNYDIVTDDDDDEYDPEEDYEDFLSDSDYECDEAEGTEESGSEQVAMFVVHFSDSDQDELPAASENNQESSSSKSNSDNKPVENKTNGEVKTNGTNPMDNVSANETDANT